MALMRKVIDQSVFYKCLWDGRGTGEKRLEL